MLLLRRGKCLCRGHRRRELWLHRWLLRLILQLREWVMARKARLRVCGGPKATSGVEGGGVVIRISLLLLLLVSPGQLWYRWCHRGLVERV